MLGAIAGDIIGSVYEARPIKTTTFPLFSAGSRFTDDTVLTVATAQAILEKRDYGQAYRMLARAYPNRGFGAAFAHWFQADAAAPYNSWGNGA
ncbi:MAG: ADP-ribosylglycohydrolase family protein, partial [Desulfobacterales bacterium]